MVRKCSVSFRFPPNRSVACTHGSRPLWRETASLSFLVCVCVRACVEGTAQRFWATSSARFDRARAFFFPGMGISASGNRRRRASDLHLRTFTWEKREGRLRGSKDQSFGFPGRRADIGAGVWLFFIKLHRGFCACKGPSPHQQTEHWQLSQTSLCVSVCVWCV